jgi:hypothetical protein
MESKKINQLATELTPSLSDLTIIGDPSTGISKKITLSQMASLFTGTVEEYANVAAFPLVGVADTIYIALDTNVLYRWNTGTNAYVELSPNIINSLVFSDANGFDGNISLVGSVATLTITTALTTGSVPFIGASGALSQDNANLFFDDTNNRLGINTNAPTTALDVFGSGIIGRINGTSTNNAFLGFASAGSNKWSIGNVQSDHRFRIYNEATTSELISVLSTGEFGIGIANPTTKIHIDGGASALIANLDANVSVAKSISFRSDNSNRINLEVSGTESGSNAGANFFLRTYTDAGSLLETPFQITRSTGLTTLKNVAITGLTTSYLPKANGSSALIDSLFFDDGTYAGIRASNPILYTINSSQKNWNSGDNIGYFDQRIEDGSATGARTVSFIRSVVSTGVTNGVTTAADLIFGTSAYDGAATEKLRINNSGNLGISNTNPFAGASTLTGLAISDRGGLFKLAINDTIYTSNNLYYDGANWKRIVAGGGTFMQLESTDGGTLRVFAAATGSAGSNATTLDRLMINSSGDVAINTGTPIGSNKLTVLMNDNTNGTGIAIKAVNDGGSASQPALSYFNGSGNLIAKIVADNGTGYLSINTSSSNTERFRIGVGNFGFTASVKGAGDADSKTFMNSINADCGLIPVPAGTTLYCYNRSGGTNYRALISTSTYFTGQHGNKPIDEDLKTNIQNYVGLIVSSVGSYYSVNPITNEITTGIDAIQISESLPEIKLTDKDEDKSVWGVVTNVKNDNYNTDGTTEYDNNSEFGDRLGENVIRVNGLGEGAIWVTNINGNIENGDYICSSIITGYGKKQNDDLLHNYTVAKSTMDCDFDLNNEGLYKCEEFEYNGQTYKKAFIGCTYHCS